MVQEFHRASTGGRVLAVSRQPRRGASTGTGGFPTEMAADPMRRETSRTGLPETVAVTEPLHPLVTSTANKATLTRSPFRDPVRTIGSVCWNFTLCKIRTFRRRRRCVYYPARQSAPMVHRERQAACNKVPETASIRATPKASKRVHTDSCSRSCAKRYNDRCRNCLGLGRPMGNKERKLVSKNEIGMPCGTSNPRSHSLI